MAKRPEIASQLNAKYWLPHKRVLLSTVSTNKHNSTIKNYMVKFTVLRHLIMYYVTCSIYVQYHTVIKWYSINLWLPLSWRSN